MVEVVEEENEGEDDIEEEDILPHRNREMRL